mgnify:FL=1
MFYRSKSLTLPRDWKPNPATLTLLERELAAKDAAASALRKELMKGARS